MKIPNGTTVLRAMWRSRLVETYTDARRYIEQNAVRVNGVLVTDTEATIDFAGKPQLTIQVGRTRKHIFVEGA